MADQETVGPAYMFNRNFRSCNRRNYNHWMIKDMCGYLLHPHINMPTDAARIADIEAGTGIWLFETAATVSKTVQLDGFDASAINYPPAPWWPNNVRLNIHDVFQPFPEKYHSRYDIVHAGFPLRLVDDQDSKALLTNLTSILKAGGYLQLFVPDVLGARVRTAGTTLSKASVTQLTPLFGMSRLDSSYNWLTDTARCLEGHGLTLVAQSRYSMQDHLKLMWAQNNLITAFTDFLPRPAISRTGIGQAMAQVLGGPEEETRDTPSVDVPWMCFVAQKAAWNIN